MKFAAMLFVLPIYFVTLVLVGTALPAAAVGDRFGLRTTLGRTARTAGPIAAGLLLGPALAGIVLIPGCLAVIGALNAAEGTTFAFAGGFVLRLVGFYLTALAVAVLCRAYRRVAPAGALPPYTPA